MQDFKNEEKGNGLVFGMLLFVKGEIKQKECLLLVVIFYFCRYLFKTQFILMSKKTKAFLFQLLCFAVLFILFRFLIDAYTNLEGYWIPITAFVVGTILAPKFQAIRTNEGEKLFMKWIFLKGIHEIK
jgi:hypothetical protein